MSVLQTVAEACELDLASTPALLQSAVEACRFDLDNASALREGSTTVYGCVNWMYPRVQCLISKLTAAGCCCATDGY